MSRPKISIEKVSNGFLVRVIQEGVGIFKEKYERDVMAFESFAKAQEFVSDFFGESGPVEGRLPTERRSPIDKEAFKGEDDEGPF